MLLNRHFRRLSFHHWWIGNSVFLSLLCIFVTILIRIINFRLVVHLVLFLVLFGGIFSENTEVSFTNVVHIFTRLRYSNIDLRGWNCLPNCVVNFVLLQLPFLLVIIVRSLVLFFISFSVKHRFGVLLFFLLSGWLTINWSFLFYTSFSSLTLFFVVFLWYHVLFNNLNYSRRSISILIVLKVFKLTVLQLLPIRSPRKRVPPHHKP